jgi:branched-chain amino acid transport system substrate-binding protein
MRKEVRLCFKGLAEGSRFREDEFSLDVYQIRFLRTNLINRRRNKMGEKKFLTWLGLFFFFLMVCLIPFSGVSAAAKTEILVGAVNSLTGVNVMTGEQQKWAYERAVSDINAQGGVYVKDLGKKLPIRLVFVDDKSTPAEGAAAMEKLIKLNKVDFALSSNITPINIAAGTVAEKYKVFFFITSSWLDQIGDQKFKWCSDFFFSTVSASASPFDVWKLQKPKAEHPKAIWLMMEDNPDGQGFASGFRGHAKKLGYTIAVDEPYTPGTKDFTPSILKAKAAKCDALLWLGFPPDSITLIRQIKEQGLNLKYAHGYKGFWPTEFYQTLGKDSNYIIHDGFWAETLPYPGCKELGESFKKAFGMDSVNVGLYYANPWVLKQAVEKAGSLKSAKVRDVMFSGNFIAKGTTMGDLKFNNKGLYLTPCLALQWMDGKRLPVNPKVYKLKWMLPWDKR